MDDAGGADEYTAEEVTGAAEELAGAADEQSADANGIGTVSVAPASVMRVVVQPHVGIGAPEYDTALAALLNCQHKLRQDIFLMCRGLTQPSRGG